MIATISRQNKNYKVDLAQPLDISIPVKPGNAGVNAWYIPPPTIEPVQHQDWIAKVSEGASVNFNNIQFNPHSHGTHTESAGHITSQFSSIHKLLDRFFFFAQVITLTPVIENGDTILTSEMLSKSIFKIPEALIIRTLPNSYDKKSKDYSHTNWPYLTKEAAQWIHDQNIKHLLVDVPSIDREKDEGKLAAHKAFWGYPDQLRSNATITELIFVENSIEDGNYILNLQVAAFQNDAAPSRPVLYKIMQ